MRRLLGDDIVLDAVPVPIELHPALAVIIGYEIVVNMPAVGRRVSIVDLTLEDAITHPAKFHPCYLPIVALVSKNGGRDCSRYALHDNPFLPPDIRAKYFIIVHGWRRLQALDNIVAAYVHPRLTEYYLLSRIIAERHPAIRKLPAGCRDTVRPAPHGDGRAACRCIHR